jgi:hypothetical protein
MAVFVDDGLGDDIFGGVDAEDASLNFMEIKYEKNFHKKYVII